MKTSYLELTLQIPDPSCCPGRSHQLQEEASLKMTEQGPDLRV